MRKTVLLGALFVSLAAFAQQRPKITGIAYVRFHTTDREAARHFYRDTLGFSCRCVGGPEDIYKVNAGQNILIDTRGGTPQSNEEEIAFETSNVATMKAYLAAHGYSQTKEIPRGFSIIGPEGHTLSFVQKGAVLLRVAAPGDKAASHRIIHVGFTVQDREAEEKFFRDLLGFKLYWTGGPGWDGTEAHRAYMSYQVPDGHEWVEFMLHRPADATAKQNGGSNHVALGVVDIQKAHDQLVANGWTGDAQPKQGLDGKFQLNLFDPDGTRSEFMEFTPTRKPCCTEYQQPHPSPNDR